MILVDFEERIEELEYRYNYNDKEKLLDDIADAFDAGKITKDAALTLFGRVNVVALKAFDE